MRSGMGLVYQLPVARRLPGRAADEMSSMFVDRRGNIHLATQFLHPAIRYLRQAAFQYAPRDRFPLAGVFSIAAGPGALRIAVKSLRYRRQDAR